MGMAFSISNGQRSSKGQKKMKHSDQEVEMEEEEIQREI